MYFGRKYSSSIYLDTFLLICTNRSFLNITNFEVVAANIEKLLFKQILAESFNLQHLNKEKRKLVPQSEKKLRFNQSDSEIFQSIIFQNKYFLNIIDLIFI